MGVGKFLFVVVLEYIMLTCDAGFIDEEKNITWFRLLELKCNKFMKLHPFARQSEINPQQALRLGGNPVYILFSD